jgi:hypothetical protein
LAEALAPSAANADTGLATSAKSTLQAKLLEPLQKKEEQRSRFSRAVTPPSARRVRVPEEAPGKDARGRSYLAFAVDERRSFGVVPDHADPEAEWYRDAIVGCVYPDTGDVFIRRGETYYAASVLLGKPTQTAPAGVCLSR